MTTAYNLRNQLYFSGEAGRQVIKDPGVNGTIIVTPFDHSVVRLDTAGDRTLETATQVPLGTTVLVCSTIDGNAITNSFPNVGIDDGGFVLFTVTLNGSGVNRWVPISSSNIASGAAPGVGDMDIPIGNNWRAPTALHTNLAAADSAGILGLETGTLATAGSTLNVTVATPAGDTFSARCNTIQLPSNYSAGTDLTLNVTVNETVAATTATVDAVCCGSDDGATDIVATAAQSIVGAAPATKSFTLTGTGLEAGDTLDLRLDITLTDVAATPEYDITDVTIGYTTTGY